MKKLPVILVLASLGMVSCKKNYTCTCITTATGWTSTSGTSTTVIKDRKKKAEDACKAKTATVSYFGQSATTTCSIQ